MKNKGYTLIELVTVMMLISIIMLIALPKFNVNNITHKTVAKNLYTDIRRVRESAMQGNSKARIVFNGDNKYTVFDENYEKEIVIGDGISLNNKFEHLLTAGLKIQFNALGEFKQNNNDPQTVVIMDAAKNFYDITILPVTGRIKLYEKNKKAPVRQ